MPRIELTPKVKPEVSLKTFEGKFSAHFAIAMLLVSAAFAADAKDKDQQAFCKYVTEQAVAQRDLLITPNAVAGITLPSLEKQALQHRLELIQQALENLDSLLATTSKMLHVQNMTRPMAFALQTTKIKLDADRADTQAKIVSLYTPQLSDRPLKELVAEKQNTEVNEQKALDKLNRQNDWDVALSVGAHQQISPWIDSRGAYGEVSVSYNLASRAINKHLDQAADAYDDWKKVQEGDVMRNADILKQQVVSGISVQDNRLTALQEEQRQIEGNLQLVSAAETTAALDFRNQLTTAQLLLKIEIGDASFRLNQLKEFLSRNF